MKIQKAIPFEIISLNEEGYHLMILAFINHTQVRLILDTGASQTAFDTNFISEKMSELEVTKAEQISSGLGTNTMESFECELNTFEIGELKIHHYKAALLDLSHVNHTYQKLNIETIQGVLGNDILLKYDALIDYKNKQIWLNN